MKYEKPKVRDLNTLSSAEGGLDCAPGTSATGNCTVNGSWAAGTCNPLGTSVIGKALGDCGLQGLVAGK